MGNLATLNEEQQDAVTTINGPLLIIAGAGSGKTRVVTFRIVHLIESGIAPSQILGLTFTNKAAGEMKERIIKLTRHDVVVCTFHSLGAKILRESISALGYTRNFTIYDEDDIDKLLKTCIAELNITDKKMEPKHFRNLISRAKNAMQAPNEISTSDLESPFDITFPAVYELYQSKLKSFNAVDFDDLLLLPVRLFTEHPEILAFYQRRWSHLLIDEYQDTNAAQYAIVKLLVEKSRNICVVGDPDQSIYSWRGANIQNILDFEKDYPGTKVIRLEQNYRSRTNILEAANALIQNNETRLEKNLRSDLGPGEKIKCFVADDDRQEADFIGEQIRIHHTLHKVPFSDMVVFYRTNAQSRAFEDLFLRRRIPYVIVGGLSFYQRREIKDILAFLRMAHSGTDFISFLRTINIPKRGLGEGALDKIKQGANSEGISIFSYCEALANQPHRLMNPIKLPTKQLDGLRQYVNIIDKLRLMSHGSLKELVISAIESTNYLDYLKLDPDSLVDRKGNLDSLIAKANEWEQTTEEPSLSGFLEELSLRSTLDETNDTDDRVNLMTIHNGKGLEFTVTFVAGLEEELFPHINSRESQQGLEEERRLCYVGITRAKEYLYLTLARSRLIWGTVREQRPSRFLREVPPQFLERVRSPDNFRDKDKNIGSSSRSADQDDFKAPKTFRLDVRNDIRNRTPKLDNHPKPKETFSNGDSVFHPEFGIGIIQEIRDSSAGTIYKVLFTRDKAVKSLIAHLAPLTKL